jgi:hypothetical protein
VCGCAGAVGLAEGGALFRMGKEDMYRATDALRNVLLHIERMFRFCPLPNTAAQVALAQMAIPRVLWRRSTGTPPQRALLHSNSAPDLKGTFEGVPRAA